MADESTPTEDRNDELALAMLTLRVAHPPGEWLGSDERLFNELWDQEQHDGPAGEGTLLLSMMNLAWYALLRLEVLEPERSAAEHLRQIALDLAAADVEDPDDD